jgi:hypothetical protein
VDDKLDGVVPVSAVDRSGDFYLLIDGITPLSPHPNDPAQAASRP